MDILNKKGWLSLFKARPWRYDIVHLHYDGHARKWAKLLKFFKVNLIATSHNAHAAFPSLWGKGFAKKFSVLKRLPRLMVLSSEIKETFLARGYRGQIEVLRNGTEVKSFACRPEGNGRVLCIGKIDPRKRQAELAAAFNAAGVCRCDFVGQIADADFMPDHKNSFYLGSWNRDEVHQKLTDYSCLVLMSHAEAHALVVQEAMAAGLSVVVSPQAAANLPRDKAWLKICDTMAEVPVLAARLAAENKTYRQEIRRFAEEYCDWTEVVKVYEANMRCFFGEIGA